MESWEAQEMKDNLAILEYEMEGTRECEVLKKARNYINDLEEMLVKVAKYKEIVNKAIPIEEWHEDIGDCLWWRFPVEEPPYCGSPLEVDFDKGYYTHFTRLIIPEEIK